MIEIILFDKDPAGVIEIVKDLRTQGLIQGQDFDFAYKPPVCDNFSGQSLYEKHTIFSFYTEELASWFTLKYTNEISK